MILLARSIALLVAAVRHPDTTLSLPDTTRITLAYRAYAALDGDRIWPGFRPDSIPVAYVVPERGTLLCGWRGSLPEGFSTLGTSGCAWVSVAARSASNTNAEFAGRDVAQLVADSSKTPADLLFLSAHEAFHVFEHSRRTPGDGPNARFGYGENSFLVTAYPIFDQDNEAGVALEARLLSAALAAHSDSVARARVWEFLAARDARQRALGGQLTEFEVMAELNEGPAEYAGMRALQLGILPSAWHDAAARGAAVPLLRLDSATTQARNSFRLRYYATGPAMATLLDRLAGDRWKAELMAQNRTLQFELAVVTGYTDRENRLQAAARTQVAWPELRRQAADAIAALRLLRQAQVDSALAAPGILLSIESPGRGLGKCGIDPQNLFQVADGVLLHRRFVALCAGEALQAQFTTPTVEDAKANTARVVIGPESGVTWSAAGTALAVPDGAQLDDLRDLRITAGDATVHVSHGTLSRRGRTVTVRLLP